MNKAIIVPIIALIMLAAQRILHVEFSSAEMQIVTDGALAVAVLIGILTDPKKKK